MPSGVNATLMPRGSSGASQPAVRRVERRQRDAGDRRRQRQRQIDQRIDDAAARERIADEHPGHQQAEHRVDAGRGEADAPSVSRYDATTRGSVTMCQNCAHDERAVFRKSVGSGISTMRLR